MMPNVGILCRKGVYIVGLHMLIAEPRTIYRKGLHTIFSHDSSIASVDEARTREELEDKLATKEVDFVIAHQSLVSDISLLSRNQFVLLVNEPNKDMLMAACTHGACGYFLENSSEDLLLATLHLPQGAFLLDPALTHWALEDVSDDNVLLADASRLTPRELEVFGLYKSGISNSAIAEQLHISKSTVKKHIEHINRKLRKRT